MEKYSGRILSMGVAALFAVVAAVGCSPHRSADASKPSPSPSASTGPSYGGIVANPEYRLVDLHNKPVMQITAQGGIGGTGDGMTFGELTKGRATLYRDGKAVATLTADKMKADNKTRILTATGNVLVRSRNDTDGTPKSVRADTMRWDHDKNQITGDGHVVLAYGATVQIPGRSFVADTAIQSFDVVGNGK